MSVLIALLLAVRAPLHLNRPVQDKNFYALSLLERSSAVMADAELNGILRAKRDALHKATTTCALDCNCFAAAMKFSDAEIAQIAAALRRLRLDDAALRASGTEILHPTIAAAWTDAANGINNIIDVYGTGKAPRYPQIDSASFDVKSQADRQPAHTLAQDLGYQQSH